MMPQAQLSPPWYTLWNEIKSTIGNTPDVTVNPLVTTRTPFLVPITVANRDRAVALASIMAVSHRFGNIEVAIQVKDGSGAVVVPQVPESAEELAGWVKTGLAGNPLFSQAVVQPVVPHSPPVVFGVFARAVVQFYNDDLSDLYRNYNNVAAFAFRNVFNPAPGGIGLYCSTAENR